MPKKTDEPVTRVHVLLYSEDIEKLHALYDRTQGFSAAVRMMVRLCLRKVEAKAEARSQARGERE